MQAKVLVKRSIAFLLALVMLVSMAACGKKPEAKVQTSDQTGTAGEQYEYTREDMELIVEMLGDGQSTEGMTDAQLWELVQKIINETTEEEEQTSQIVDLGDTQQENLPQLDPSQNKDAYNEDGGMNTPFDQVYPEVIEKEQVTFSGESILIKLKSDKLTDGLKAAGIGAVEEIVPLDGCAWYEAMLVEGTDAKTALAAVRELDEVMLAEFNYEIQTAGLDDYKHFDKDKEEEFKKNGHNKDQWHFHYCGIPDGYEEMEKDGGDPGVIVAVIDSGVDYDHEDLKDNMWVNTAEVPDNGIDDDKNGYIDDYYGVDIVSGKGNGDDTNGHGTHVAGIIAARNNNVGVMGIAYNVKIMSVKAAMHNGALNQADIAKAVLYAYENGAEVINMSFGGTACSIAVQDALATAYTRCVLVASAGNNGAKNEGMFAIPNYPAALTYVLGVMSVDETGRESVFTNWDVFAFNGVEYELYAPGENIMSTLPNNQYGYLSGTSMAAPVVSAFAAILRSEFSDRDMYPTKFIYGQLASTSGIYADCLDPETHGPHNLPQIANLNDALTKLPKPEVNVQDYALFDDPKYSDKNNGDGVIDAGETIALGLTLQNRWGMSENTKVTIDTISESSGMADPYFTIQNPTVDYGSVGTYSTQDCGKLYTDELFSGWENPFLIQVSEDCPNDYRFTLNVVIRCENALDEDDDTLYVFGDDPLDPPTLDPRDPISVNENVRSGYVLPSVIEEDMVLTKENLYIIPNATVITEGTTVRVEPGTHIQFWSDDANDPYADSYIAYLLVNGNFLVEGTKEEPVYIYPSQLMDQYGVEIGSSSKGYVSLKYADVTNFFYYSSANHTGTGNSIDLADHCTFRNNYGGAYVYYRYLESGVVRSRCEYSGYIGNLNAKDCVFYKLAFYGSTNLRGSFDRCIFTQCGINYNPDKDVNETYRNCVFLGNSMVDQTNPEKHYNSSNVRKTEKFLKQSPTSSIKVLYRPETGTTYLWYDTSKDAINVASYFHPLADTMAAYLSKVYDGDWFIAETMEEYAWLCDQIGSFECSSEGLNCGIQKTEDGLVWCDGTPLQADFSVGAASGSKTWILCNQTVKGGQSSNAIYEIPGQILPEEITFREYTVDMDLESTYQVTPLNTPVQLPVNAFLYESTDEGVLTVSDTGMVTPVGKGTADVWVYSLDKAVKNRVTVTVREYVALEDLAFPAEVIELAVGETAACNVELTPANTTRRNVTYTSSDPSVVKVENGMLTAVGEGSATITATCEGVTDTMAVSVYTKATSLALSDVAISASLADGTMALPQVITNENADTELSWRSTDEAVAAVVEGALVLKGEGTTSLVVTDRRSGLSATCLVIVTQEKANPVRQIAFGGDYDTTWVLLEDGSVYVWNSSYVKSPVLVTTGVDMIAADKAYALFLKDDGTLEQWVMHSATSAPRKEKTYNQFAGWEIRDIELYTHKNIWVTTADGSAYAMGSSNDYGQLGIGNTQTASEPTLINLDGVVDIENKDSGTWLLTDQGELYAVGYLYYATTMEPVRIDTNVAQILCGGGYWACYLSQDGKVKYFNGANAEANRYYNYNYLAAELDQVVYHSDTILGIRDGKVYTGTSDGKLTQVLGITDAKRVFTYSGTHYVATESGLLLAFGKNPVSGNRMTGVTLETQVTTPVMIPLVPLTEEEPKVMTDLDEGVLNGDELTLTFNKSLSSTAPKLYADGTQVTVQSAIKDYNHLVVSRSAGFAEGVSYELVFEAGTIHCAGGVTNTEEIRIAFTYQPEGTVTPDAGEEDTTTEDTIPENTAPVVYESILDESIERVLTSETVLAELKAYIAETQYNPSFTGNAILNPISTDTEVSHWLRIQAPTVSAGSYSEVPLGGNWWGTANETAIGLQLIDYADFPTNYARIMYAPYLTQAPENTFPFVTSVKLINKYGEEVTVVGNEEITFRVTFNRDMDTSIPLQVRFGSAYPYGDYEITDGAYVDARTWEGKYTLKTTIENGYQYFTISNGCSATDDLELQLDQYRFGFEIDTTAAQALIMQGTAMDTGIELKWTQDDFDTLMGYNVYRSTKEDGQYTRLNKTVVPADTMTWFDDTVEPGVIYYYNFTVVQTDLSESEPSGKIVIMSKDTMAPNIYHSPVASAFTGSNLVLTATITDNLNIAYANLYYRVAGTETWKTVRMNKLNDKYSAIIPAEFMTVEGIEYYIDAFDGITHTYKGSAEAPYTIAVKEAVSANALGDVDGDGTITNLDALLLLYTINDKYNMTDEEFARADLDGDGELMAKEALRILQYVSGVVGSVQM